ncbi:rhomboid family intramembrane serine protease [Corynebacterium vitaeruminis]|uniref:rhomboid family intramembrane serine protease n=1 Tax=Corynebacterium vitaeruminis TaxID=38305 RepID=UPI00068A5DDD|nr:rhomboid family intramembrane serine protease [Corynebacterium vitaeruminis]
MTLNQTLARQTRGAPGTVGICIATVAVFIATAAQSGSVAENLSFSALADSWILFAPVMHDPLNLLRAVGAMFLHVGPAHLVMNTIMIFFLGREVERYLGTAMFLAAYFISGVGASLMVMVADPLAPTAGASGALYGLMAVLLVIAMRTRADVRAPLALIAVNLGYSFIASGVSLWGHVGGLVAGALVSWPLVAGRKVLLVVFFVAEWAGIWYVGTHLGHQAIGL